MVICVTTGAIFVFLRTTVVATARFACWLEIDNRLKDEEQAGSIQSLSVAGDNECRRSPTWGPSVWTVFIIVKNEKHKSSRSV